MSDYPGQLDSFTAPGSNLGTAGAEHSTLHVEQTDAIAAVQAELGVNPAGSSSTVAARLNAGGFTIPLNTIGAAELEDDGIWPINLEQATIWDPLHGQWASYNSQPTNVSTGVGGVSAFYKRVGSTCHVDVTMSFGAGSAISGTVLWFLPFTPVRSIVNGSVAFTAVNSSGGAGSPLGASTAYAVNQTNQVRTIWTANPSGHWDGNGPLASGSLDGKQAVFSFSYEVTASAGTLA